MLLANYQLLNSTFLIGADAEGEDAGAEQRGPALPRASSKSLRGGTKRQKYWFTPAVLRHLEEFWALGLHVGIPNNDHTTCGLGAELAERMWR